MAVPTAARSLPISSPCRPGIMRWKKGVLVTDAPDILYFEDTDGDGKADVRRVVLTGFAFSNPQHTVNNPVYGLDNWIYLAHEGPATAVIFTKEFGDRGSDLHFPDRPGGPALKPARRMVRFRPDTYELEYLSSSTQFGHSFDESGHQFTVSNEDHIREEVIAARYLSRNPDLPVGRGDGTDIGSPARRRRLSHLAARARGNAQRRRILHVRLRNHGVSRRSISWRWTILADSRTGAESRAPGCPDVSRRHVRCAPGARGSRVSSLDGRLVPAGQLLHRPGRRNTMWLTTTG